jgi:putative ABC transport system substrate-binding protein
LSRRQDLYVARIPQGQKPADLLLQQSDQFEPVVNLQTAKALGLTIAQSIPACADEVME